MDADGDEACNGQVGLACEILLLVEIGNGTLVRLSGVIEVGVVAVHELVHGDSAFLFGLRVQGFVLGVLRIGESVGVANFESLVKGGNGRKSGGVTVTVENIVPETTLVVVVLVNTPEEHASAVDGDEHVSHRLPGGNFVGLECPLIVVREYILDSSGEEIFAVLDGVELPVVDVKPLEGHSAGGEEVTIRVDVQFPGGLGGIVFNHRGGDCAGNWITHLISNYYNTD